jgi:hypothetical protein
MEGRKRPAKKWSVLVELTSGNTPWHLPTCQPMRALPKSCTPYISQTNEGKYSSDSANSSLAFLSFHLAESCVMLFR